MHFGHSLFPHLTKAAKLNLQKLDFKTTYISYLNIGISQVRPPASIVPDQIRMAIDFLYWLWQFM